MLLAVTCRFLGLALFLYAFSACERRTTQSDLKRVIGDDDLITVDSDARNIPYELRPIVDAIGELSVGCTVTHIGGGFALTAGHCLQAGARKEDLSCSGKTVTWGKRAGSSTSVSKCERIVVMQQNETGDFALLKVSDPPKAFVSPSLDKRPAEGTKVTIFSHPDGQPLQWSQYCAVKALDPSDQEYTPEMFGYVCDTSHGSSGAAVIDVNKMTVVGIHNGGSNTRNFGTYLADASIGKYLEAELPQAAQPSPIQPVSPAFFGPFDHNEARVLKTLGTDGYVSFRIDTDTEHEIDYVIIRSANNKKTRISGKKTVYIADYAAPVVISFHSDGTNRSRFVELSEIEISED